MGLGIAASQTQFGTTFACLKPSQRRTALPGCQRSWKARSLEPSVTLCDRFLSIELGGFPRATFSKEGIALEGT